MHESIAKRHQFENCDYCKVLYGRWAERAHHTKPYKNYNFQNDGTSGHFTVLWSVTLKIGAVSKLGLFFPVVCFIHVFGQTLAEQLYNVTRSISINLRCKVSLRHGAVSCMQGLSKRLFSWSSNRFKSQADTMCSCLIADGKFPSFPTAENWCFANVSRLCTSSWKILTSVIKVFSLVKILVRLANLISIPSFVEDILVTICRCLVWRINIFTPWIICGLVPATNATNTFSVGFLLCSVLLLIFFYF